MRIAGWSGAGSRAVPGLLHRTMNYVHHNPVHHGYVEKWDEWPFSSARHYLKAVGRHEAMETWRNYPVLGYGKGWDDTEM